MTWDEQQAEAVKRANAAQYRASMYSHPAATPLRNLRTPPPVYGNRTVSRIIIAALAALCAFGVVAEVGHVLGVW